MNLKNNWRSSISIVLIWFVLLIAGCGGSSGGSDPVVVAPVVVVTQNDDGTETTTTAVTGSNGAVTVFAVTSLIEDDSVIVSSVTVTEIDGTVTETVTYPDGSRFETVTEPDGTVTETVTDEVTDGDGITLGRVAVTVIKPDGETIRTVTTTDPDGVVTEITTNSKELSVSVFTAVHSLVVQDDGQIFDVVTADIEFTNDLSEPLYITEAYFAVGTCGGLITGENIYEFGYADYDGYLQPGDPTEHGYDTATLYRRFTDGTKGPCDLYAGGHSVKFIIETVVDNDFVILMEAETTFTVKVIQ